MNGTNRAEIKPGQKLWIVLKQDQRSGKLTQGMVKKFGRKVLSIVGSSLCRQRSKSRRVVSVNHRLMCKTIIVGSSYADNCQLLTEDWRQMTEFRVGIGASH